MMPEISTRVRASRFVGRGVRGVLGITFAMTLLCNVTGWAAAGRAFAADATCPATLPDDDEHLFAGTLAYYNSNIYGARATINFKDPDLCDNSYADSNGVSSAWTMVSAEANAITGRLMYAQIGYYDSAVDSDSGLHYFAQWTRTCVNTAAGCTGEDFIQHVIPNSTPSGTHTYSVKKKNTTGEPIWMYFDGNKIISTGYDPTGVWDSAWNCEFLGEVNSNANDVPGLPDPNQVTFNDLTRYDSAGTARYLTSAEVYGVSEDRYHRDQYDPPGAGLRAVDIWTFPNT